MSNSTEQSDVSLVFADHEQNYYLIPAETFERGRVPVERRAEIEQALREHDVTGYFLLSFIVLGAVVGAGVLLYESSGVAAGTAAGYTMATATESSDCFPVKPTSNETFR